MYKTDYDRETMLTRNVDELKQHLTETYNWKIRSAHLVWYIDPLLVKCMRYIGCYDHDYVAIHVVAYTLWLTEVAISLQYGCKLILVSVCLTKLQQKLNV